MGMIDYFGTPFIGVPLPVPKYMGLELGIGSIISGVATLLVNGTPYLVRRNPALAFVEGAGVGFTVYFLAMITNLGVSALCKLCKINYEAQTLIDRTIGIIVVVSVGAKILGVPERTAFLVMSPLIATAATTSLLIFTYMKYLAYKQKKAVANQAANPAPKAGG